MPGKLAALQARFREHTTALFEKQGITNVGYWTNAVGGSSDELVYMLAFDDVAHRERAMAAFQADPETKAVMMIGEIGGSAEEEAAEFIKNKMSKPVVSYVAGVTAPAGKKMGHAGAIVSGGKGTAAAKMEALEAAGVRVGKNPTEAGELMVEVVRENGWV